MYNAAANPNTVITNNSMTGIAPQTPTPTLQTREGYEVYEGGEGMSSYANPGVASGHDTDKYGNTNKLTHGRLILN